MKIAFTMSPGRGDTDELLFRVAETITKRGFRATGTVQINTERPDAQPCDMDVKVLPEGPLIRISQSLGPNARGCRLNPEGLERAVGEVQARLEAGVDCLIVNKFGKQEADGRGFRPAIGQAVAADIPVLVGLNHLNAEGFEAFAEGAAVALAPDHDALVAWLTEAMAADRAVQSMAGQPVA